MQQQRQWEDGKEQSKERDGEQDDQGRESADLQGQGSTEDDLLGGSARTAREPRGRVAVLGTVRDGIEAFM